jgi:ATP-dependent Clp protease ATP-binding subunit ClpX
MPFDRTGLDPEKLLQQLNQEVYGQKWAKEKLTDALAWNQERLRLIRQGVNATDLPAKANVLFVGPTGCGKTLIASTAAKYCKLPYYYTTATEFSAAGYVGRNADDIIAGLLEAAGGSVAAAEEGIVFIDEVDKIRRRNFGGRDDVGGESVQHALLTLLEGKTVTVGSQSVDTSGITFVAGGAFTSVSATIGPEGERQFEAEQLIRFGLIPEFIGRFSVRVGLAPLTAADLRVLLLECRSSTLWKTRNLFARQGIELVIDNAVIDAIIERAERMGTGARSLDEMVKDRCLGLMCRLMELRRRGVKRLLLREDGVVEEMSLSPRRQVEPQRGSGETSRSSTTPQATPDCAPPPPTDPFTFPPTGSAPFPPTVARESTGTAMTPKAWATLGLTILLLLLGIGAYRHSLASPSERGRESEVRGEETPRLLEALKESQIPR